LSILGLSLHDAQIFLAKIIYEKNPRVFAGKRVDPSFNFLFSGLCKAFG
jgi:hypothetical protein